VDDAGCVGTSIRLRSGLYLDLNDPQADQFGFADIAGGLSKLCRFGGQCEWFYSVAEHSVWACRVARDVYGLALHEQATCLMHDAAEAFLGDVVKPLKNLLPEYHDLEHRLEGVIAAKFGIALAHEHLKEIDLRLLFTERKSLFTRDQVAWNRQEDYEVLPITLSRWNPAEAEEQFFREAARVGLKVD
jgi:hypothetical protein